MRDFKDYKYHDYQVIPPLFGVSDDTLKRIQTLVNLEHLDEEDAFCLVRRQIDGEVGITVHATNLVRGILLFDRIWEYMEETGICAAYETQA